MGSLRISFGYVLSRGDKKHQNIPRSDVNFACDDGFLDVNPKLYCSVSFIR